MYNKALVAWYHTDYTSCKLFYDRWVHDLEEILLLLIGHVFRTSRNSERRYVPIWPAVSHSPVHDGEMTIVSRLLMIAMVVMVLVPDVARMAAWLE